MSNYKPPFEITSTILNYISKISELLVELKFKDMSIVTPTLRKKNRVKTLAGTLEIEGNFIGEDKITAMLEGKRVLGTYREIAEVEGAIKAYQELENYRYGSLSDLLYAHKLMMGGVLENAGKFRNVNVKVGEHIAPQPQMVSQLMEQLFTWLGKSDEHLILKSCVFHYEFEFIHPFSDGNGRIGRLWQSVILYNYNPIFATLPIESLIKDKQNEYYKAIEKSTELGESTPFIVFMLEIILNSLQEVGNRVGNRVGSLSENQIKIVELMKSNPKISAKLLSENIGISTRKIEDNIAKLKKLGLIKRVGKTRGYWEVLDM